MSSPLILSIIHPSQVSQLLNEPFQLCTGHCEPPCLPTCDVIFAIKIQLWQYTTSGWSNFLAVAERIKTSKSWQATNISVDLMLIQSWNNILTEFSHLYTWIIKSHSIVKKISPLISSLSNAPVSLPVIKNANYTVSEKKHPRHFRL